MGLGRRTFLQSAAAALAGRIVAETRRQWNFVFVLADDLGWSDLGIYGADLHETPHIDRFASTAMRFTQAYAASPVCSPTRASIMTGKHPARLGITIWHEGAVTPPRNRRLLPAPSVENLPLSEVTFAEVLQQAGYATAHIGKWHLGTAPYYPEAQGFDINVGGSFWGAPRSFFHPYRGTPRGGGEYRYVPGLGFGKKDDYLTDRLTEEALNAIGHMKERPFFLNLWHHSPHTPIEAKPADVAHFSRKLNADHRHRNVTYAAMVKNLDDNFGRLLKHLDATKLAASTVVIFMSDNGGYTEPFANVPVTTNTPLRSGKGSLYEGGIRVPLIVRWPGVTPRGAVCDTPVVSTDLYRTVLEMAGLPGDAKQNEDGDGLSIAPLLQDPRAAFPARDLFFHYPHYYPTTTPVSAVRSGDWKLLEYFEDGRLELFNLKEDPGETRNLAPSMPTRAGELLGRLRTWREHVDARLPDPNPNFTQ